MNKNIENFLDKYSGEQVSCWVIVYNGKFLKMPSGKNSWEKEGHARNAFHNAIKTYVCDNSRGSFTVGWNKFCEGFLGMRPTEVLDYCIKNNIVKFVNLSEEAVHQICGL